MSRERELLAMAFDYLPDGIQMYDDLRKEIRSYLAEPEQDEEPVAWTNRQEINALNEECTVYMYAEPMEGEDNIPLYLHPAPRPDFVRLSEEEIMEIVRSDDEFDEMMWDCTSIRFARVIEDALEKKNTINKSDPNSVALQSRCRGDKL